MPLLSCKRSMASYILKIFKKKKGSSQDGSTSGHSSNQVRHLEPNVTYDTSLPALHSYLGSDLEELSGRTVLDDDSCHTIPIISLPGVILIPGQILPLQLFNPSTISMMIHIIHSDRTFGLINSRFSGRAFTNVLDTIGTTVEIRSYREEEFEYGGNILRIKAEGRQRFEVLETRTQSDGILIGKVRILPELNVGDPSEGSKLNSLSKFKVPPPNLPTNNQAFECRQLLHKSSQKYNKYDFANYTWFPEFVYKMYDPEELMNRIKHIIRRWNQSRQSGDLMPCNPKEFSYWVLANLPLNDQQRVDLLRINEVTDRLRQELKILEEGCVLSCKDCHSVVAMCEDIFSMSLQGPQGTYVNSNGYVHEAITVHKIKHLLLVGRPSVEQSWFPGYAWTIVECEVCHGHMGWRFTAVDKNLTPLKFWALCRSSIQAMLMPREETVEVDV